MNRQDARVATREDSGAFARIALALLVMGGCHGSGKGEAAALDDAVDRYRRAEGTQKASESQTVADLSCTVPEVCDAKKACLAAMGPTTRALAIKDEVARMLVELQQKRLALDAATAEELPGKLDEATRLLQEGKAKMADCEKQLVDLRLHFGH
jgi:hypothetical protein